MKRLDLMGLPWMTGFLLGTVILLIVLPEIAFHAAIKGITIWWDILFPALFPFFVISELMLGVGIVHFFGTLLDPLMRPLFRVPGSGGFVMAMGYASGYPVGARLTAQLWEQKLLNRDEGERLVAFTSTADPIFLIGAVAVGFFHNSSLAVILLSTHYGGGLLLALLMRFHGSSELTPTHTTSQNTNRVILALKAMHHARLADGRSLGFLLKDAITSALRLIIVIGGLVVLVSVLLALFSEIHLLDLCYVILSGVFQLLHIPLALTEPFINGIVEVTLGAKSAGAASLVSLKIKVAAVAFILSWGGLSVHAQIASLLSRTNLRYAPFAAARFIHGVISAILVFVLWEPLQAIEAWSIVTFDTSIAVFVMERYKLVTAPIGILIFVVTISILSIFSMITSQHTRN